MVDLPSRDDILKFIAEQSGSVGKREIAHAFRLSGSDRIALKNYCAKWPPKDCWRARKSECVCRVTCQMSVLFVTGRDRENNLIARDAGRGF